MYCFSRSVWAILVRIHLVIATPLCCTWNCYSAVSKANACSQRLERVFVFALAHCLHSARFFCFSSLLFTLAMSRLAFLQRMCMRNKEASGERRANKWMCVFGSRWRGRKLQLNCFHYAGMRCLCIHLQFSRDCTEPFSCQYDLLCHLLIDPSDRRTS